MQISLWNAKIDVICFRVGLCLEDRKKVRSLLIEPSQHVLPLCCFFSPEARECAVGSVFLVAWGEEGFGVW